MPGGLPGVRTRERTMAPPRTQPRPALVFAYTVYLYFVAGLALLTVFAHQMLLVSSREDGANGFLTGLFRFLQATELAFFLFALTVAVLRSKESVLARPTTAAVSILLVTWFPFGTAAFIWWVGWVRRRERLSECAEPRPPRE